MKQPEGEGISAGVIKCSWLLTLSCVARSSCHGPAFLTLQAAHFLTRAPSLDSRPGRCYSEPASRAESLRERDTWPVAVTSVSPRPEIRSELRTERVRFIVVFWKRAFPAFCFMLLRISAFSDLRLKKNNPRHKAKAH